MEVILAIDIGTSSVKVAIINFKGQLVENFQTNYPTHCLKPNILEQNPGDWWDAVKSGIYQILNEKQNTKISKYDQSVKRGSWDPLVGDPIFRIENKIFGIIGFGSIGKRVAEKIRSFKLSIIVYDPFVNSKLISEHSAKK